MYQMHKLFSLLAACRICGAIVPVVPMSEWTWRMSFGKYLELSFYHRNLASKPESCGHDAFRDHIRYFGLRGLAVRFEYQEIDLLELVPPPMHTVIRRDCLETLKASDVERLRADVLTFYQSVSERLRLLGLEESATNSTVELRQALVELSKRIPAEKTAVWSLLQETASTSSASDVLALNSVRKVLYETCLDWDRDFADIARRYLLSERTDRRVTAGSQIRRLFMDATDAATAGTWSLTLRRPQNGRAAQATIDDVNSTGKYVTV